LLYINPLHKKKKISNIPEHTLCPIHIEEENRCRRCRCCGNQPSAGSPRHPRLAKMAEEDFVKQEFNPSTGRLIFVNTKTGKKGWSREEVAQTAASKAKEKVRV
jgi:hypothetical protein